MAPGEGARGACPAQRAMTVLAVNRVQQTYTVPTYAAEPGTPDLLLPSLVHTHRIDTRRLAAVPAATVHVGSPPLVEGAATPLPPPPLLPPDSVTVVMPARNAAATVGRAVRSVLRQRGAPRFRLVVLDDGSTDGTAAAVTAAAAECEAGLEGEGRGGAGVPEVRVVRRGQEGRHSAALAGDALLLEVGSPWFARIDADDSWDEHHLQRLCGAAEAAGPAQHVVGTQVVRASGEQTRVLPLPCDPLHVLFSALFYCPIAHSGALVRTQTAVEAGGYTGTLAAATSGVGAARAADTVDTVSVDARVGTAGASSSGAEAGGYTGTLAGAIDTTGSTAAASEVVAGTGGDVDTADGAAAASSSGAESGEGVVAEDYGLWTRVLARYPLGVSNLSDALTTLHRHGGNVRVGGSGDGRGYCIVCGHNLTLLAFPAMLDSCDTLTPDLDVVPCIQLSSVHASLLERRGDDVAAAFARAFVARDSGDKEQDKEEEDGPISLRAIAVLRRPESGAGLLFAARVQLILSAFPAHLLHSPPIESDTHTLPLCTHSVVPARSRPGERSAGEVGGCRPSRRRPRQQRSLAQCSTCRDVCSPGRAGCSCPAVAARRVWRSHCRRLSTLADALSRRGTESHGGHAVPCGVGRCVARIDRAVATVHISA